MTGTQISYYFHCRRHLWLFSHKIHMEHNSDNVSLGKHISDSTFKRVNHEIQIDDIVLDFFDPIKKIVHEVKKTDKMEEIHIWQLKYYIYRLEEKGISGVTGVLNYPKLRKTLSVRLSDNDRIKITEIVTEVDAIIHQSEAPSLINKPFCKKCSYYELCYI
ncbi:MAG: CRISPR-associated protein Cas4 [Ignavibacteriaceae bacterium]|nr:CRISPR-associated protein Cas4 [Ignavibacteriaceae bacterium]HPO55983.1 CRISPR-associated protein Cas4 [Ignavibacteriaceae bacterium]